MIHPTPEPTIQVMPCHNGFCVDQDGKILPCYSPSGLCVDQNGITFNTPAPPQLRVCSTGGGIYFFSVPRIMEDETGRYVELFVECSDTGRARIKIY